MHKRMTASAPPSMSPYHSFGNITVTGCVWLLGRACMPATQPRLARLSLWPHQLPLLYSSSPGMLPISAGPNMEKHIRTGRRGTLPTTTRAWRRQARPPDSGPKPMFSIDIGDLCRAGADNLWNIAVAWAGGMGGGRRGRGRRGAFAVTYLYYAPLHTVLHTLAHRTPRAHRARAPCAAAQLCWR